MGEKKVFIQSGNLRIEGLLETVPGTKAAVMTHPHPLYGGNMLNNVVESVLGTYVKKGYTTLRFNFRGVGGSEGSFDEGKGEQNDVEGALDHMSNLGKIQIDLIGYSFGAWVIALGMERFRRATRMIMISPPVSFIDFSFLKPSPKIQLIIAGSEDQFAQPAMLKEFSTHWNPAVQFELIHGADHFYWGRSADIQGIIDRFLDRNG